MRIEGLKIYTKILRYLKNYRAPFALALFCMVLFGASDGVVPFLVKHVLDDVFSKRDSSLLLVLPIVLVAFALIRGLCDFGQQFLMARIGHCIVKDIRNEVNAHLLSLSPDYFIAHSPGNLLALITSDVLLVRTVLTDSIAAIIRDTIRIIALLIAAIYLDPFLALIAFVVFPVGIVPVYKFGRKIRKLSKRGQEAIGSLSGRLHESIAGNRVVKIFGREKFEQARFEEENSKLTQTFVKSERLRALTGPVNELLASCAIAGIILYGGYSVIHGFRSQGDFIAFLLSVFLLYDPFKKLSRVSSVVQQGLSGAERIFEILAAKSTVTDPPQPLALGSTNTIHFEHVSFSYGAENGPVLDNIELTVPEGSCVAIVGFSGAGKSTLVDLIPRFIDPSQGSVKIGGVDIARVRLAELRSRIAMVGQHTFLFNDTVYNNIAYGNQGATKQTVLEAARAAYATDFIERMPQGFNTIVGEGGYTLSGGERQRIAIARAILKNAPILILDEATASLDNRSEREVQLALETLEHNRTTLVIAHRLSTIREADLIVVLKDGRIVEVGKHEELLKHEGEYARLHLLQFASTDASEQFGQSVVN